MIDTLVFDADDTLWHNEGLFSLTHRKFSELLQPYHEPDWVDKRLYETEVRNLKLFGYGIKGFTLSMIETAIELTEGRISGKEIQDIIELGKQMICAPVEPLPHVRATLDTLAPRYTLMVITKGDLFDQESKLARSGLGDYFKNVEVVSEKDKETYASIFKRLGLEPQQMIMVGNSLKSDILPVVALGVLGIHIPYHTTWVHEHVDKETLGDTQFHTLADISELPHLLESLSSGGSTT